MSNTNDPNVPEPIGIPPVPPAPQYGAPYQPQAPQYAAPQPQYAPQPTPQPQYIAPQPGGVPPQPQYAVAQPHPSGYVAPTNGMAIAALITGILVPLVGIILGHISLGQIKRTGENGRGMALAGLICGYVFTAFTVLYFGFIIIMIIAAAGTSSYNY